MFAFRTYRLISIINWLLFFIAGIFSIIEQTFIYVAIPFVWICIPFIYQLIVVQSTKLFWLAIILIPLSTEINISPSIGMDFPIEIILILITGVALLKMANQPNLFQEAFQSKLLLLITLHLIWIFICSFFSTEPILSIKYLLAKTWYIIPFVIVTSIMFNHFNDWKKLALCLCIPMVVLIAQVLFRFSFYEFEFASIKKTMFPFFRNHVNYSALLVCLFPVGWGIWKISLQQSKQRKIISVLLILAIIALLLAYSRGAWLAMIIGSISVIIFRKKWMGKIIIASLVFIGIGITWLCYQHNYMAFSPKHDQTIFHENFSAHLTATVNGKDISNAERIHRWVAGIRMVGERPIIGFGPNSFYHHYQPYTVSAFKTWVSNNPEHSTVHNYFLLVAIEQGLIGLIIFLAIFIYMILQAQYLYHQFQSDQYRTVSLLIGVILIMIGVINIGSDLIETDKIGSIFWLCGGALIALKKRLKIECTSFAI